MKNRTGNRSIYKMRTSGNQFVIVTCLHTLNSHDNGQWPITTEAGRQLRRPYSNRPTQLNSRRCVQSDYDAKSREISARVGDNRLIGQLRGNDSSQIKLR